MSLDFSVREVADFANVTTSPHPCPYSGKEQWHPVTNTLVWLSIPCGYSRITAANIDEVWARVSRWQAVMGPFIGGAKSEVFITREDVRRHIGLSTNASQKNKTDFKDHLLRQIDEQSKRACSGDCALDIIGWKGQPAKEAT